MIADQVSDLIQFGIILVGLAIATPIVLAEMRPSGFHMTLFSIA